MKPDAAAQPRRRLWPRLRLPVILLVPIVLGLLVALPLSAPMTEIQVLNEISRTAAPGKFVALGAGMTHYEIAGPESGAPVVFVHGFSTPYFIWDKNFPVLAEAGYRVLRYDLFGRGFSDRPANATYDDRFFDQQLAELLAALKLTKPVTLVGVSMGGAIAVGFAERHPALVKNLILVDPAGFPLPMPLAARLLQVPLLGEYLMRVAGLSAIRKGMADNFHDQRLLGEFREKFEPQLRYAGYFAGQLATLRHMPLQALEPSYRALGQSGKPVLLVWGRQDAVLPYETTQKVLAAVPQAQLLTVDPAGHVPNYERPDVVNPALLGFLNDHR